LRDSVAWGATAKRVEVRLALLLLAAAPSCGRIPPTASPSPARLVAPLRRETLIQGAFVAYTLFWQVGVPGGDPVVFRADGSVENARAGLAGRWTVVDDSTLRIRQTDPMTRQVHDLEFRLRVGEGDLASPPPVAGETTSPRYWIRRRGPVTNHPVPAGAPDTAANSRPPGSALPPGAATVKVTARNQTVSLVLSVRQAVRRAPDSSSPVVLARANTAERLP
jgi:hypothetical protein